MRMNERRTKMSSVKRKLTNKTLVQKWEIIRHIEKGMTNKEASERFGVLKNTISTWIKNKEKRLAALQETSSHTKKIRSCDYAEVDKAVFQWFSLQSSQHVPIDGIMIKEKALFYAEKFKFSKLQMGGWKSGRKGEINDIVFILRHLFLLVIYRLL